MTLVFRRCYVKVILVGGWPRWRYCRWGNLMWWREGGASGVARLTVVVAAAALLAGCFQPLYGERSLAGSPTARDSLSSVSVMQITALDGTYEARLAVQIRNDLLFNFT